MGFTEKNWIDGTTHEIQGASTTAISAVALEDLERRVTDYTDLKTAVSVKEAEYGATGDGTTDDYAAIAAAVTSLGADGGIIYFPPGTYRLSSSITAGDHVHFLGAGREAVTIKPLNGASAQGFNLTNDYCSIRDLTVDGNLTGNGASGYHAIRIQGTGHTIDNVKVLDSPGYGIGAGQGADILQFTMNNVIIDGASADGIDFKNTTATNRENRLSNIVVRNFDIASADDKAGIDIRGPVALNNIFVYGPATGSASVCIRFRGSGAAAGSSLTNFRLEAQAGAHAVCKGIEVTANVNVSNGYVTGFGSGVKVSEGPAQLTNIHAASCDTDPSIGGFNIQDSDVSLSNCFATDCHNAYLISGSEVILTACRAEGSTRGFYFTGDRNKVIGGALIGGFATTVRTDAGADDNRFLHVDFTQGTAGSEILSGARTRFIDCPDRDNTVVQAGTITSGTVTLDGGWIRDLKVDTQGGTATTDDLVTISGGEPGQFLSLRSANAGRDPVVKDGTGNIRGSADFTLANPNDTMTLVLGGTTWREIGRSTNGA